MRLHILLIISTLLVTACAPETTLSQSDQILQNAFDKGTSGIQVEGGGIVISILDDDTNGVRHQRFILQLNSGQTLLIAHNIDIATRINNLQVNDWVSFYGEYEWNNQGGLVHWTHIDPDKFHVDGWLKHKNITYDRK